VESWATVLHLLTIASSSELFSILLPSSLFVIFHLLKRSSDSLQDKQDLLSFLSFYKSCVTTIFIFSIEQHLVLLNRQQNFYLSFKINLL
jgi:hypothetical protein